MIRNLSEESRIELEAAFAGAAIEEAAWRAARTVAATPVTATPAAPVRRLPPRPSWYTGGDHPAAVATHQATAGALGPRKVRAR